MKASADALIAAQLRKRALGYLFAPLVIPILASCGIIAQNAAKDARASFDNCMRDAKASPEAKIVFSRLWSGDATDTADKLTDQRPLTKNEKNALLQYSNKLLPCRQIVVTHDTKYAAWETPYFQEFFQRQDILKLKLLSDEITVGLANRLAIESTSKLQVDLSKGYADATRVAQEQQQRAAEAMLASIPQTTTTNTTTNCSWIGNNLNCNSSSSRY